MASEHRAQELSDLLARVEGATGESRELDCAVALATGWHRVEPRFTRNRKGAWIAPDAFMGVYSDGRPVLSQHGTAMHRDPPRVTASVDAALALVERVKPGFGWEVRRNTDMKRAVGVLYEPDDPDAGILTPWPPRHEALGATPALAILAALLRALLHDARDGSRTQKDADHG